MIPIAEKYMSISAVEESLGTLRGLISQYEKRVRDDSLIDELHEGQSHGVTRRADYAVARGDRRQLLGELSTWAAAALQRPVENMVPSCNPDDTTADGEAEVMSNRLRRVVTSFRGLGSRLMELANRYENSSGAPGGIPLSSDAQRLLELDALKLERALLMSQCADDQDDVEQQKDGGSTGRVVVVERIPPELLEAHDHLVAKLEDHVAQLKSKNTYLVAELDEMQTQSAAFKIERELISRPPPTQDAETMTDQPLTRERGVAANITVAQPSVVVPGAASSTAGDSLATPSSPSSPPQRVASSNTLAGGKQRSVVTSTLGKVLAVGNSTSSGNGKDKGAHDATCADNWRNKFQTMSLLFLALRFVTSRRRHRQDEDRVPTTAAAQELDDEEVRRTLGGIVAAPSRAASGMMASSAHDEGGSRKVPSPSRRSSSQLSNGSSAGGVGLSAMGTLIQANTDATIASPNPSPAVKSSHILLKQHSRTTEIESSASLAARGVSNIPTRAGGGCSAAPPRVPKSPALVDRGPSASSHSSPRPMALVVRCAERGIDAWTSTEPAPPPPPANLPPARIVSVADAAVNTLNSSSWLFQGKQLHLPGTRKNVASQTADEKPQETPPSIPIAATWVELDSNASEHGHHHPQFQSYQPQAQVEVRPLTNRSSGVALVSTTPSTAMNGSRGVSTFPTRELATRRPLSASQATISQCHVEARLVACGSTIPIPTSADAMPSLQVAAHCAASSQMAGERASTSPSRQNVGGMVVGGEAPSSHHFSTVRIRTNSVEVHQADEYIASTHCMPTKPPSLVATTPRRQAPHYRHPQNQRQNYTSGIVPARPATAGAASS